MKYIIWGAGAQCLEYCKTIDADTQIVAIVDNNQEKFGKNILGHSIISPTRIVEYDYDKIVIALNDSTQKGCEAVESVVQQLLSMGISQSQITLSNYYYCDISYNEARRVGFLYQLSIELNENHVEGAVAECGVYRGWFAKHINEYFPDRKLYLFDTFSGFDERDVSQEKNETTLSYLQQCNMIQLLQRGNAEITLLRCPYPEKVIIKPGYVPETFTGIEQEKFSFVNLDMDLYLPSLEALRFFAPRMSRGGVILLHDYYVYNLPGVKKAVDEFAHECNFTRLPIGDGMSIALVIH